MILQHGRSAVRFGPDFTLLPEGGEDGSRRLCNRSRPEQSPAPNRVLVAFQNVVDHGGSKKHEFEIELLHVGVGRIALLVLFLFKALSCLQILRGSPATDPVARFAQETQEFDAASLQKTALTSWSRLLELMALSEKRTNHGQNEKAPRNWRLQVIDEFGCGGRI
jgi:hypothetical protein